MPTPTLTVRSGLSSPQDVAAACGFNQAEFDRWQAAQSKAAQPAAARCAMRLARWLQSFAAAATRRANKSQQTRES